MLKISTIDRNALGVITAIFLALFLALSVSHGANALSCGSNASTQYACDNYGDGSDGARGAMWFNDVSTGDGVESDEIDVTGDTSSEITLYLHGAVYGGYGSDYFANNIHITTDNAYGSPYQGFNDEPSITLSSDSLYRGYGSGDNGWSEGWEDGFIEVTIDAAEFVKNASSCGDSCYEKQLYAYRCYGYSYSGSPGSCYADPVNLIIRGMNVQNFDTSVSASIDKTMLYMGETATAEFGIKVSPLDFSRDATDIENPTIRRIYFVVNEDVNENNIDLNGWWDGTDEPCAGFWSYNNGKISTCGGLGGDNGYIYPSSLPQSNDMQLFNIQFTTPDDDSYVGKKYCVAIGIKPADSDRMDNWNISDASCRTIAKKPSVAVKDSSVFSNGSIATSISSKTNGNFGSWAEYLTVANGSISKFSSGAVLNANHDLSGCSTNAAETLFPLTISNTDCSNLGNASITPSTSFINWFTQLATKNSITSTGGDCKVIGSLVICPTTYISESSQGYNQSITDAASAQLVFYNPNSSGETDITIDEKVTEIDAWIIAPNGTIKTCNASNSPSSDQCTNQLTINGIVYSKDLELNRTAGAGAGNNSGAPAEIIDLNPITYVWASNYFKSESGTTIQTIRDVYTQELAPRL